MIEVYKTTSQQVNETTSEWIGVLKIYLFGENHERL